MDVQLAAARALTWEAASLLRTEPPDDPGAAVAAARAKLFGAEAAVAATRSAIRVQGGTGFMREGGTERFARCARALQFVGEAGPMQRDLLKRAVMPGLKWPPAP
jgi:alkylation response protein AidB-like acyl-CoA dehydrogenase